MGKGIPAASLRCCSLILDGTAAVSLGKEQRIPMMSKLDGKNIGLEALAAGDGDTTGGGLLGVLLIQQVTKQPCFLLF